VDARPPAPSARPAHPEPEPEPEPAAPPPRRRRPWRLFAALALLAALVLTHALWLPPLAELVLPPLAGALGYDLRLDRVERLDLRGLALEGLELVAREPGPLARLEVDRVEASFERALLAGDLGGLTGARARGVRVELGSDDGGGAPPASGGEPLEWPRSLPELELSEVELRSAGAVLLTGGELAAGRDGALRAAAVIDGRRAALLGRYEPGALVDLAVDLDGEPLARDSRVAVAPDLSVRLELRLALPARAAALDAEVTHGRVRWRLELLDLDLEALAARLAAERLVDLAPAGRLDLATEGELALEDPIGATLRGSLAARGLTLAGWSLDTLEADLEAGDGELRVPGLRAAAGPRNRLALREGRLPLRGASATELLAGARAEVELELEALEALLEPAGLLPPEGLVRHRLALVATLADERLSVREGGLVSDAGAIELTRGELWLERQDGRATPGIDLAGRARVADLTAFGELLGRRGWAGELEGDLRAAGRWPDVRLEADLAAEALVLEDLELGELEVRARTDRAITRIDLERLEARTPHGTARARAALTRGPGGLLGLEVEELRLENDDAALALTAPARARFETGRVEVEPLVLDGSAGRVELEGRWGPEGATARVRTEALRTRTLLGTLAPDLPAAERADLDLTLALEGERLRFESAGALRGLAPGVSGLPPALDLDWALRHDGERLRLERLALDAGEALALELRGEAPLTLAPAPALGEGPLALELESRADLAALTPGELGARGRVQARGTLGGSWGALSGELEVLGEGLLVEAAALEGLQAGTLRAEVRLGDGVAIEEVSLRLGERLDLAGEGRVGLSLDARRWLQDARGALEEAGVVGALELASLEVEHLGPLLEPLGLAELLRAGRVDGRIAVEGPLLAPRPTGSLNVADGRVRPGGGLPSIDALQARVLLTSERVELARCTGTVGAAPFTLSGGVDLSGEEPRLDLQLSGRDLLLFRDRSARVRADAELALSGAPSAPHVAGELRLTDGRYAPDTRFLNLRPGPPRPGARGFQVFSLREPPLAAMTFDVAVTSAEPFEVRNLVLNGRVTPDLRLAGTGLVPLLEGRVYLDRTALLLPAGRLTINGGTVLFSRDDPFVPTIEAVGEARMLGHDIRAGISGPYDNPEVELSSTPPLSQETLLLLLLTGQLQQSVAGVDDRATATTVAVYIAQDTLGRLFAGDGPVDEDSVFERLELLYGEDVSQDGTETFDVAFRLSSKEGLPEELRNRRHWFLTAQRDRFEDYNYGVRLVLRLR
jgi:hypothetical protein